MAVLASQKQRGKPSIVNAVHETKCIEKHLDNVVVAVPCRLVQRRIAELHAKKKKKNYTLYIASVLHVNIAIQKIFTVLIFLNISAHLILDEESATAQ